MMTSNSCPAFNPSQAHTYRSTQNGALANTFLSFRHGKFPPMWRPYGTAQPVLSWTQPSQLGQNLGFLDSGSTINPMWPENAPRPMSVEALLDAVHGAWCSGYLSPLLTIGQGAGGRLPIL